MDNAGVDVSIDLKLLAIMQDARTTANIIVNSYYYQPLQFYKMQTILPSLSMFNAEL